MPRSRTRSRRSPSPPTRRHAHITDAVSCQRLAGPRRARHLLGAPRSRCLLPRPQRNNSHCRFNCIDTPACIGAPMARLVEKRMRGRRTSRVMRIATRSILVTDLFMLSAALCHPSDGHASSADTRNHHISCPANVAAGDDGHGTLIVLTVDTCALTIYASTTDGFSRTYVRVQDIHGKVISIGGPAGASATTSYFTPYKCGMTYIGVVQTIHSDSVYSAGHTPSYKACSGLSTSP